VADVDFDADGTAAVARGGTWEDKQDYMMVRQFVDGKPAGGFLTRSLFPTGLSPGYSGDELRIVVTPDRVGVLVYSGNESEKREWVELDLKGGVVERIRIDKVVSSPAAVAFTDDDHVYLQARGAGGLFTLQAALHAWKPVPNQGVKLTGADGKDLVYREVLLRAY
jgi:hypothetical protein